MTTFTHLFYLMLESKNFRLILIALAALGLALIFKYCQPSTSATVPVPTVTILPDQIEIIPDGTIGASDVKLRVTDSNDSVVYSTPQKVALSSTLKFAIQRLPGMSYRADFEYFKSGNDISFAKDGVILGPSGIIVGVDVPMLSGKNNAISEVSCECFQNVTPVAVSPGSCLGLRNLTWAGTLTIPDVRMVSVTKPASGGSVAQTVTFIMRTTGPDNVSYFLGNEVPAMTCLTNTPNFCLSDADRLLSFNDAASGMHFSIKAQKEVGPVTTQKIIIQCHSSYVVEVRQGINCGQSGG